MNKKPIQFFVLAIFQFLTPLFNIAVNAATYHRSPLEILRWTWDAGALHVFECLLIGPTIGMAVILVRRWSYPVIVGGAAWTALRNIFVWSQHPGVIPFSTLLSVNIFPLLLIAYFLLPSVRAVYLYPIIRWWELSPRFQYSDETVFTLRGARLLGKITNISLGGMFVETSQELPLGRALSFEFEVMDFRFELEARPVFRSSSNQGGYGLQFVHNETSRGRMERAMRMLERYEMPRIPERRALAHEAWDLAKELSQGRGIIPKLSPAALEHLKKAV